MSQYFVRHGETDWNAQHKIQGRIDVPLNETGLSQARKMRDKLKELHFDAIFSSPLMRALETAKIIAEPHGIPIVTVDALAERNFGDYEGRHNNDDYYGLWQHSNTATPNGETPTDLKQRVFPFLDHIQEQYAGKDVLLVAHGGVGLIIETYYKGVPASDNLLEYAMGNGELRVYDFRPCA